MDRDELIQRTFPYLLKRLEDAGINATPEVDPQTNGYILTVDTMRFNVENLLSDLSRSDPAQHHPGRTELRSAHHLHSPFHCRISQSALSGFPKQRVIGDGSKSCSLPTFGRRTLLLRSDQHRQRANRHQATGRSIHRASGRITIHCRQGGKHRCLGKQSPN